MTQSAAERKASSKRTQRNEDGWYKRDPEAYFDGTRELSLEERGAYSDILDMIYMHGGAIPYSDRVIAGLLVINIRKWNYLKGRLLAAKKLFLTAEGYLHNKAAEELLTERGLARDRRGTSAGPRRDRRGTSAGPPPGRLGNTNKINTTHDDLLTDIRSKKEEKREEEKKEDGEPAAAVEQDAAKAAAGLASSNEILIFRKLTELAGGDVHAADVWLRAHRPFGEEAIRIAVGKVADDVAAKKRVVDPLKLASAVLLRIDGAKAAPPVLKVVPPWRQAQEDPMDLLREIEREARELVA